MRVLVTGGTGFIGSKIVEEMNNHGYEVIVFDINTKDGTRNNVLHIKGDIFDTKHVLEVLNKCDAVIHMVGLPIAWKAQERPQLSYDLNVRSVQAILEAMRETEVKKIILPSSAAIYGQTDTDYVDESSPPNPTNTYAYHKWISEEICRCYSLNYGIRSTILRLFNVYGSEGTGIINILVEKAQKNETIMLFGENQLRDFINLYDVAKVIIKVLECEECSNQTINVGTGVGRSIGDIVGLFHNYFPDIKLERKEFTGRLYNSIANITRLKELTGYLPDGSIEILKKTIEEMI